MTKIKDNGNIADVVQQMTGKNPQTLTKEEAFNYTMPLLEKMYNLLQPSFTTVATNNVILFNSNEEVDDNAYPIQLIDYYNNASPTFSNLIDLRRNMLIGNGLQPVVENDAAVLEFLNAENMFGQTLQDIWELICFDYSLFEMYFLEVLFSTKEKDGRISQIIHHDASTVRAVANDNPALPYINVWMLSRNWGKTNKTGKNVKTAQQGIPIGNWQPERWAEDGGRQLLACKRYTAGNEAYAIPSYNSILPYVELDAQLAQYNLGSVTRGFTPTSIVVLNGNPDKKAKDDFINRFKARYMGANGERVLFIWTTNENDKPTIMPFNTVDNTPMIELLDQILTLKITSGLGANLELVGAATGGQSLQSDMNKLAVSYNYYYMTKILPMQKQMLQVLNKIFKKNGLGLVTVVTPPLTMDVPQTKSAPVPDNSKSIM